MGVQPESCAALAEGAEACWRERLSLRLDASPLLPTHSWTSERLATMRSHCNWLIEEEGRETQGREAGHSIWVSHLRLNMLLFGASSRPHICHIAAQPANLFVFGPRNLEALKIQHLCFNTI